MSGTLAEHSERRAARLRSAAPKQTLDVVRCFEDREPITQHPLMQRLASEEPNLHRLWLLLANFQISISKNFARRLASIAGRVEDERIRCILAEQLNDEMGRGRFADAHINLFSNMMKLLEAWRPPVVDARVLGPGHRLDPRLARIYEHPDVYASLGAVMAGEVFGKQMDQFLGDLFRRQTVIDTESLTWLVLHEQLEVTHAEESSELAKLVPPQALTACWQGACDLSAAGWLFLDDVYELAFGDSNLPS